MTDHDTDTRVFTVAQLDAWGIPDGEMPDDMELHREQVDTRRWVSVHELVFRAPDDGYAWAVTYEVGLTEYQDYPYPFGHGTTEVTATRMVQRDTVVTQWVPAGTPEPAAEPPTDGHTAFTQIANTPALQGLRAELRIDGHPPLIGRYSGAGLRRALNHPDLLVADMMIVFEYADRPDNDPRQAAPDVTLDGITGRFAAIAQLADALVDQLPGNGWHLAHAIKDLADGTATPAETLAEYED